MALISYFGGKKQYPVSWPEVGIRVFCVFILFSILPLNCLWCGGFERLPLRYAVLWVKVNEGLSLSKRTLDVGTFYSIIMGAPLIFLLSLHESQSPYPGIDLGFA